MPKLANSESFVRDFDANGYRYDVVTNPEGTVHINLPHFNGSASVDVISPDYLQYLETCVTGLDVSNARFVHNNETVTDNVDDDFNWATESGNLYTAITITNGETYNEMKIELNNKSGKVLDTYVIRKTK